jgi:cellulose synthase/poly-beta-1,6-N-acetylglucosamine synthase-like glycosyltransferase
MSALVLLSCLAVLGYTFVAYPLLVLASSRRAPPVAKGPYTPATTLLIAAFDETAALREKLESALQCDFPPDQLQILVAVDAGCRTETVALAHSFEDRGVEVCDSGEARGKNPAMDLAMAQATGEVVVFTDATSRFEPGTVRELVANFRDDSIGCVGGVDRYPDEADIGVRGDAFYRGLENLLRRSSEGLGYVPSVAGTIHALRHHLYEPVSGSWTRDLIDPAQAAAAGLRTIVDRDARCVEVPWRGAAETYRNRVRVTIRGCSAIPYIVRSLAAHRRWSALWQFVSHKVLRWFVGFPMLGLAISSLLLASSSKVVAAFAALQFSAWAIAGFGVFAARRGVVLPGLSLVSFLALSIVAMTVGCLRWASGRNAAIWKRTPLGESSLSSSRH